MIQELVNYSKWLKKDFPDLFEGKLEKGLHVFIKLNCDKICKIQTCKIGNKVPSRTEENKFVFDFAKQIFKSNVDSANKCLHNDKYILSNNPFCYKLNLVTDTELRKHFDFNDITKNGKIRKRKILNHINAIKKDFLILYDEETRVIARKIIQVFINISFEMIRSININDNGNVIFTSENEFVQQIIEKIKETYLKQDKQALETSENFFRKINKKKLIIYFDVDKALYDKTSDIYKQKKGGLKQSIPNIDYQNTQYTLNSFINNANENKIFLKHLTAFSKYNYYHKKEFDELLKDFKPAIKELPNPLPIFIVKSELNDNFIKIFKNDKSKGYKEIISELFRTHKEDLNNYYLFNGNSVAINDFDYVSSFSYEIDKLSTNEYFELFHLKDFECKVENIFDLEKIISQKFLFKTNRDNKAQCELLNTNYFSDKLDAGKGNEIPAFIENNIYKYRKLLYDAFYKSRLHLITANIFKDICMPVIRYEISHDETNNNGNYSQNEFRIKEKLLIYIHLNKLFDKNNINFGGRDMPSELPKYRNNLLRLLRGEIDYYQSDEDFAFGTGQLIRYLLKQSESGNKNHSMFEPFLQKLGNFNIFITQINRALKTYGHKIKMNYDLFDKMMSNSTSYKIEADKSLKDLETILISGYFAKPAISQILEEKQKEKNNKGVKND